MNDFFHNSKTSNTLEVYSPVLLWLKAMGNQKDKR